MDARQPPIDPAYAALLDADLIAELDAAHAADPVDPQLAERVKRRVLRRIAAEATARHHTVHADGGIWQPFDRGVQIKVLHEEGGVMSYLLKLEAGAMLHAHRHPVDEECVVLQGSVRIGDELEVHAGGFHLGRRDVLHAPITTEQGATIFLRGAAPEIALVL